MLLEEKAVRVPVLDGVCASVIRRQRVGHSLRCGLCFCDKKAVSGSVLDAKMMLARNCYWLLEIELCLEQTL